MNVDKTTQTLPKLDGQARHVTPRALYYRSPAPKFDRTSPKHRQQLLEWCQLQWPLVFQPARDQKNTMYFHLCCSCFSRRYFSCRSCHPTIYTCALFSMKTFKHVNNAGAFFEWLLDQYQFIEEQGFKCYFPCLKRFHIEEEAVANPQASSEMASLQKRVLQLSEQIADTSHKLLVLQNDNQQLLKAGQNWFDKYQALLFKQTTPVLTPLQTPIKNKTELFCDSSLNLF